MKPQRILYVGSLGAGGTCRQRLQALRDIGHMVAGIEMHPGVQSGAGRLALRIARRLGFVPDVSGVNVQILNAFAKERYDILWIDKGLVISPYTLREMNLRHPDVRIVSYSPDDMCARHNQSRAYVKGVPLYDMHVTTKSYNVAELAAMGARRVVFVDNAYDPHTHRPVPVDAEDRARLGGRVGFIGAVEGDRVRKMLHLAGAGIPVRVWGWTDWSRHRGRHPLLTVENRPLWGDDYVRAVCAFDINLGFLRKMNRDLQTTRSIEIPACGAFMLAERTSEHLRIFEEGKEAEYFESQEELLDKTKFYLGHEEARNKIAAAGLERCRRSGYDNASRLRAVLSEMEVVETPPADQRVTAGGS